jgi:hypothetical protein
MIRNPHETIDVDRVIVRQSDLLEAVIVALESGEFRQIRGAMWDDRNGRCAYGVVYEVGRRAGFRMESEDDWRDVFSRDVESAAVRSLGYVDLPHANDAGATFAQIAHALRQAREELG